MLISVKIKKCIFIAKVNKSKISSTTTERSLIIKQLNINESVIFKTTSVISYLLVKVRF